MTATTETAEAPRIERDAGLSVRIPQQVRDSVVELSRLERRSISEMAYVLLAESLERRSAAEDGGR